MLGPETYPIASPQMQLLNVTVVAFVVEFASAQTAERVPTVQSVMYDERVPSYPKAATADPTAITVANAAAAPILIALARRSGILSLSDPDGVDRCGKFLARYRVVALLKQVENMNEMERRCHAGRHICDIWQISGNSHRVGSLRHHIGILIATDVLRLGVQAVLEESREFSSVATAPDLERLSRALQDPPSAVVVEVEDLGPAAGRDLEQVRRIAPRAALVALRPQTSPRIVAECMRAGFAAVVTPWKPREHLLTTLLNAVMGLRSSPPSEPLSGELAPLSAREVDVLRLLAAAHSNKQIGLALGIAESTVKHHTSSIYQKLNVASRTEAVLEAQRLCLEGTSSNGD